MTEAWRSYSESQVDGVGPSQVPWAVWLLDVDRDGLSDLITTHGNDGPRWEDPAFRAGQYVTLRLRRGGFCFRDATAPSGLGRHGQWRALAGVRPGIWWVPPAP